MKNNSLLYWALAGLVSLCFAGCGDKPQEELPATQYRVNGTITVDGLARTYLLNLPPNYDNADGFSLVIAMHGGGGSGAQFETSTRLTEKANAAGFIVVYPDGVESPGALHARTWNAGGCCDYARDNNINDVKFIRMLIAELNANYKINPRKVYATGHSNGGMLAYRLACEATDVIAAIAPNGCSMVVTSPCNPSRPMPVLHMHSVLDTHVPVTGGHGITGAYYPPLDSVFNVFALKNTCPSAPVVTNPTGYHLTKWLTCQAGSEINYYLTDDGGHAWPGGLPGSANGDTPSTVISANDLLWDFFQRFQLP